MENAHAPLDLGREFRFCGVNFAAAHSCGRQLWRGFHPDQQQFGALLHYMAELFSAFRARLKSGFRAGPGENGLAKWAAQAQGQFLQFQPGMTMGAIGYERIKSQGESFWHDAGYLAVMDDYRDQTGAARPGGLRFSHMQDTHSEGHFMHGGNIAEQ